MIAFDKVWADLQKYLKDDNSIKNWTAFTGYLGDTMTIVDVREKYIEVDSPNAMSTQVIPKKDFESVWEVWADYKRQKVQRQELTPLTRFSKYIISILHWYEKS